MPHLSKLKNRQLVLWLLSLNFPLVSFRCAEKSEDELEEVCRSHLLPTSILQLKELQAPQQDDDGGGDERGASGAQFGVFSLMPVPRGSSFGPFQATLLTADETLDTAEQTCLLKVTSHSVQMRRNAAKEIVISAQNALQGEFSKEILKALLVYTLPEIHGLNDSNLSRWDWLIRRTSTHQTERFVSQKYPDPWISQILSLWLTSLQQKAHIW